MIKQLLKGTGEFKKQIILTPLTMLGEVSMEILIPYVMALMIDNGIKGAYGLPYTIKMGCLMIGLAAVALFFGVLSAKYAAEGSMGMAAVLRKRLFDKVQDFSFSNVDQFSTASLITRITTDVANVQRAAMMLIRAGARAILMFVGALFMSLRTNVELSSIFIVIIPFITIAVVMLATKAMPRFKEMLKKYDDLNLDVQENLTGIRVVKAFVREEYEDSKFKKGANEVRAAQLGAEKIVIWGMPLMFITMSLSIVSVLWFGSKLLMDGNLEVGQLTSFTTYIVQVLIALMLVAMVMINLVLSRASAVRIVEVLDAKVDLRDDNVDSKLALADGSIIFENVSFQYAKESQQETLANINLSIKSGQTVGIIGGTGAGKTSLVQLIPRLYDITKGNLLVGGHAVKDYALATLRNDVAMVLQNNVLFSGTIKDNLRWGNKAASDEELEEACRQACAHDFIMAFPDKYDTELGRGGVNVSGGQKQRLCIARALLKSPKVVILDDSTSAVDTATDSKIRAAFKEHLKGTTTLIIAQRITSIMEADQIIVMDEGMINAVGTHQELLATNNIYQEVYNSQQKGSEA
jgi:ABC-type multidrug transport system, ATPase and permease components